MKSGLVAGVATFAVAIGLLIFTVPGLVGFIAGLFDDKTIGGIAGLVVAAVYVYVVAQVALIVSVVVGGLVGVTAEERANAKRRRNRGV